ncbi:MAG: RHS repeat-associated core domain-containing protein [Polyangiaceae bacterium]
MFQQSQFDYLVFDETLQPVDIDLVELTTFDGRKIRTRLGGGVERVQDAYGNFATIAQTGIAHSSGYSVSFARDGAGRITTITDPVGATLNYAYSASGDLASFTDRAGGTTTYHYQAGHLLERLVDPTGRTRSRFEYDASGRMTAVADGNQALGAVDFDPAANQADVVDAEGAASHLSFDTNGRLTQATGPNGATAQVEYDALGRVTKRTDALGHTTLTQYDAKGKVVSETDQLGHTTTYTNSYNAQGQLTQAVRTDATGAVMTTVYTTGEKPLKIVFPSGEEDSFAYDSRGLVTQVSVKNGAQTIVTGYAYDAAGHASQVTDPLGNVVTMTHDALGRLTKRARYRTVSPSAPPVLEETLMGYDGNGRVTSVLRPDGSTLSYGYDGAGRRTSETDETGMTVTLKYDPAGRRTRMSLPPQPGFPNGVSMVTAYDDAGRTIAEMDEDGHVGLFEYDPAGHVTLQQKPGGGVVSMSYDLLGRPLSMLDELGRTTTHAHDAAGRRTQSTISTGATAQRAYDAVGRQTAWTDENGVITQAAFDPGGRMTQVTRSTGESDNWTLDPMGQILGHVDALGNVTAFGYDAAGRKTATTDALGHTTLWGYDELGNRTSMTDANGHTTTWEYDSRGHVTRHTLPNGAFAEMYYDPAGRLTQRVDFNGQTVTLSYDAWGRLTQVQRPDGTTSYGYSASGLKTFASDGSRETLTTYDSAGRVAQTEDDQGHVVTYGRDAVGLVTSITSPSGTVTYERDLRARMTKSIDPDGGATVYGYDTRGNLASIVLPNGANALFGYDSHDRPTSVSHRSAANVPFLTLAYEYDELDRFTKVIETGALGGATTDYLYDARGHLTAESVTTGAGTAQTLYAYDPAGNRTSMTAPAGTTTYQYDVNDRLTAAGTATFGFDANGNLTQRTDPSGTALYDYDSLDRLAGVTPPSGPAVAYGYDGNHRRVSKSVGGAVTRYVVEAEMGFSQVLEERDEATDDLIASYSHGLYRARKKQANGLVRYYHLDPAGSVRALSDAGGAMSDAVRYDAYGNVAASIGAPISPYGFKGEETDPETGWQYLRARYYDPQVGRFSSRDTYPVDPGDLLNRHRYVFGANDPVMNADPSGRMLGGLVAGFQAYQYFQASVLFIGATGIWSFVMLDTYNTFNIPGTPSPSAPPVTAEQVGDYYTGNAPVDLALRRAVGVLEESVQEMNQLGLRDSRTLFSGWGNDLRSALWDVKYGKKCPYQCAEQASFVAHKLWSDGAFTAITGAFDIVSEGAEVQSAKAKSPAHGFETTIELITGSFRPIASFGPTSNYITHKYVGVEIAGHPRFLDPWNAGVRYGAAYDRDVWKQIDSGSYLFPALYSCP